MATLKTIESPQIAKATTLSGEDALKVLELLKGSTSVELKLMVQDMGHRAAVKGLRFDPVEAEPRQAYFFDTPDLALNKAGVGVRARRIQGRGCRPRIRATSLPARYSMRRPRRSAMGPG